MIRLYGKGAVVLHDEKQTYAAMQGVITVPPRFEQQLLAMGFSRTAPPDEEEMSDAEYAQRLGDDGSGDSNASTSSDVENEETKATDEPLVETSAAELELQGAETEEDRIAQHKELVDGGLSDAEARELVWPEPAAE